MTTCTTVCKFYEAQIKNKSYEKWKQKEILTTRFQIINPYPAGTESD